MTERHLLEHLEQIAIRLGVELRYENLNTGAFRTEGGLCRLMDKHIILINSKDSQRRKILTLVKSLKKFNLDGIFIPPAVRRLIETQVN